MTTAPSEHSTDYLAAFESFQLYDLRAGRVVRGRIRRELAEDSERLAAALAAMPGPCRVERLDGRVYATLRIVRGREPRRLALHAALLALTAVTALAAGADLSSRRPKGEAFRPFEFAIDSAARVLDGDAAALGDRLAAFLHEMQRGVPYAAALLFVLLAHETGHSLAARRHGVDATLPFVLPAPILFGTFGAVIRMRSPIPHRRALFDIGVAGPLAGLTASVAVCLVGLSMSRYTHGAGSALGPIVLSHSPLFRACAWVALGPPGRDAGIALHPVAIAGWFGMLMTFLNLVPLGQLDGGHVAYAVAGRRCRWVYAAALGALIVLGFGFPGWLMLALVVLVLMRFEHPPVMDESVSLGWGRRAVAVGLAAAFAAMFLAQPVVVR